MTDGKSSGRLWLVLIVIIILLAGIGFAVYRLAGGHAEKKPAAPAASVQLYTCPMHPEIIRDHPGNCPICGMTLVPIPKKKSESMNATDMNMKKPAGVAGQGTVEISPEKQQLIGVVTTTAARRPLHQTIRAVGIVTADESRLADITSKVEGWVEKLYADETGKLVTKGQPLLAIYSPDLVSTQQEYLLALRSQKKLAASPFPEARAGGNDLLEATRQRLRLWDISSRDIARLEKTGEARKTLTLYAPASGYIMEKTAVAGMKVTPDMTLFRLADLSHIWVEADIYEFEAPLLKLGDSARLTAESLPGRELQGKITFLYPTVGEMTRTLKARLEFPNPKLELKPGMYVNVAISSPAAEALAVPESAVIDTGVRKVVFVKQGEGTFIPREVTVGVRAEGYYPVLSGLQEGEVVVSSANFLIDSESRFQSAVQAMEGMGDMGNMNMAPAAGGQAGHGQ
jgi:RND family efflux transporter MFP subunit